MSFTAIPNVFTTQMTLEPHLPKVIAKRGQKKDPMPLFKQENANNGY